MTICGNNTTVVTKNGITSVVLHSTEIVRITETEIVLDSGGWKTVTTKARMNSVSDELSLGYQVYARKGEWRVSYGGKDYPFGPMAHRICRSRIK